MQEEVVEERDRKSEEGRKRCEYQKILCIYGDMIGKKKIGNRKINNIEGGDEKRKKENKET